MGSGASVQRKDGSPQREAKHPRIQQGIVDSSVPILSVGVIAQTRNGIPHASIGDMQEGLVLHRSVFGEDYSNLQSSLVKKATQSTIILSARI